MQTSNQIKVRVSCFQFCDPDLMQIVQYTITHDSVLATLRFWKTMELLGGMKENNIVFEEKGSLIWQFQANQ